jgi:hypothetical protein
MTMLLERLLTWIADAVDRSLLPVPELDEIGRRLSAVRGPSRCEQPSPQQITTCGNTGGTPPRRLRGDQ